MCLHLPAYPLVLNEEEVGKTHRSVYLKLCYGDISLSQITVLLFLDTVKPILEMLSLKVIVFHNFRDSLCNSWVSGPHSRLCLTGSWLGEMTKTRDLFTRQWMF